MVGPPYLPEQDSRQQTCCHVGAIYWGVILACPGLPPFRPAHPTPAPHPLPHHSPTHPRRLDDRSVPQMPAGFGPYLQVAGLIAFLLPAGALLALAAGGHGSAGLLLFGGYLLAFVPQALMEVKLFNREMGVGVF